MAQHATANPTLQLGWLDGLVKHRRVAFVLVALVLLSGFNGIWRVGLDSALYLGVSRSLANGDGFSFAGELNEHVYPGLPIALAGLRLVFGDAYWPGCLLMLACGIGVLWLSYRLVVSHFPAWVATLVVLGVGLNARFVKHSHELMTDMPFLLACLVSMLGFDRLRGAADRRGRIRGLTILAIGLAAAAALRPTFWVLAIAWAAVCLAGLLRSRNGRRRTHLATLAMLSVITLVFALLDPRVMSASGIYNRELSQQLHGATTLAWNSWREVFHRDLPVSFFGQTMNVGPVASLALLIGAAVVSRRLPHWGCPVFVLAGVAMLVSSDPRYFLMVLPVLWLGWVLIAARLARWSPASLRGPIMMVMVLLPVVLNSGRLFKFIFEQRSADRALIRGEDRLRAFYSTYNDGEVLQWQAMADLIRRVVQDDEKVVAPRANVLAYLSGKRVFGERRFLLNEPNRGRHLQLVREFAADYWVFPATLYKARDGNLHDLMRRKQIVPSMAIEWAGEMYLAKVVLAGDLVRTEPADGPTTPASAPTTKKNKKRPTTTPAITTAPAAVHAATQPTAAPTKAKKKKRPTTGVSTPLSPTPSPTPSTAPSTAPAKKKKKKPATSVAN
jgi:hypothetical protein